MLDGDQIVHVGRDADGPVDETLDLRDRLLTPGFINTHTHLAGSPLDNRCSRTSASVSSSTPRWPTCRPRARPPTTVR